MLRFGVGTETAPFGPHNGPATVVVAGDTAAGKSTDAVRALGGLGLWGLSVSGGLKPAAAVWGLNLARITTIEDLHTARTRIKALLSKTVTERVTKDGLPIQAILLDNVSQPASRSHAINEAREEAKARKNNADPNAFAMWAATMDLLLEIRDDARRVGVHLAINGDLRHPSTDEKGIYHLGGLSLPSRGRTADFAKLADLTAVMVRRPESRPAGLHGARYLVGHDPGAYYGRDRHHVAPVDGPANLGELLRGAGYWVPRHPLMADWAEPAVAWGAQLLAEAAPDARGEVLRQIKARLRRVGARLGERVAEYADQELLTAHLIWCLGDVLDRAEILIYHAERRDQLLGDTPWALSPTVAKPAPTDDE